MGREKKFSMRFSNIIRAILIFVITTLILWLFARSVRQSVLDDQLVSSCDALDTIQVRRLISQGANPNSADLREISLFDRLSSCFYRRKTNRFSTYNTALHVAFTAANSHNDFPEPAEIMRILLKAGGDPNILDRNGNTLIDRFGIAQLKWTKSLSCILSHRGTGDLGGYLCVACARGSDETIELLLNHGIDPNSRDRAQEPAIEYAIRFANLSTVRALVRHGADVNINWTSREFHNRHISSVEYAILLRQNSRYQDEQCRMDGIIQLLKTACAHNHK